MAETKTTVPVKVKMGAEKIARTVAKDGTDIAASNLPEFEEGSLIICKDTGNLYIDMPNESKRYSVGIGHQSINRGETFNNHYNMNCALADSTYAAGYKTQAGYNYFKVTAIDVVNKKITLGDATGLVAGLTYDILDFNALNDKMKRAVHGTISKIEGTVVTVDNLPENTDADKLANLRFTIRIDFNTITPTNPITNQVYGNIQTNGGDQAYAIGERARAIGFDTFVGGQSNTAYGSYSSVLGRKNIAYGNNEFISGSSNIACGSNSAVFGAKNKSKGNQNFTAGVLNTSDGNFQTVIGLCNDNKAGTLFEVGNGTYETVDNTTTASSRSNAFEVYLDGHAELQVQGTTDNSVVIKKYLNDTIASQVSSVYKAKGSITDVTALPTPDKDHEGFVYNIENEFTTTGQFVEGTGKTYSAGTNVVCVNTTGITYKWDVLAGMVDLSGKQDKFAEYSISNEVGTLNYFSKTKGLYIGPYSSAHIYLRNDFLSLAGPEVLISSDVEKDFYHGTIDLSKEDGLVITGTRPQSDTALQPNSSLTLNGKTARFELFGAQSSPLNVIGIATPLSEASTFKGIVEADLPYQAVNKEYVDTNFQAKLVSGTNIKSIKDDKTEAQSLLGSGNLSFKTINNQSLLGSGNITIEGGGGTSITVDAELSETSTNPVQNKVITEALNTKWDQSSVLELNTLRISPTAAGSLESQGILLSNDTTPEDTTSILRIITFHSPYVLLTGLADGVNDHDAVNVSQLNTKQDALTSTTDLAIRSVTVSNVSTKLLQSGTDALQIVGSEVKLASNNKAAIKITNLADGTATSDAVNKGQLNAAVANKQDTFSTVTTTTDETTLTADKPINITTNKYSMVYDDVKEAIKITFA